MVIVWSRRWEVLKKICILFGFFVGDLRQKRLRSIGDLKKPLGNAGGPSGLCSGLRSALRASLWPPLRPSGLPACPRGFSNHLRASGDLGEDPLRKTRITYIYIYSPSTSDFSSSAFGLGRKNPRFWGYIVGYCPHKHHIYITYNIYIYVYNQCLSKILLFSFKLECEIIKKNWFGFSVIAVYWAHCLSFGISREPYNLQPKQEVV